jgi:hypothetical protein
LLVKKAHEVRKIPEVQLLREQQQLFHSLHTPAPQIYEFKGCSFNCPTIKSLPSSSYFQKQIHTVHKIHLSTVSKHYQTLLFYLKNQKNILDKKCHK